MRHGVLFLVSVAISLGCAQVMVARQPSPLDRKVLQPGAERATIAGTLGAPTVSEPSPDGTRLVETYNYTDGGKVNSVGAKAGRIVIYTAADVFTLFLTQLLWIPAELLLDGTDYSSTVEYDRRQADQRWTAARVTETKQEGNRKTTIQSGVNVDVAAAPAATQTATASVAETSNGTCFAVGNGLVMTSYHVVEGSEALTVRLADGRTSTATLERMSRGADLAILRVEEETRDFLTVGSVEPLNVGQRVFTIGFPATEILGPDPKFSEGAIGGLSGPQGDATLLQITVPVQPGNSGGPLVNERGEVVGIVTSTAAFERFLEVTGALPQNVNWAVNAEYAAPLLGEQDQAPVAASRDDAVERTQAAICRVEARR